MQSFSMLPLSFLLEQETNKDGYAKTLIGEGALAAPWRRWVTEVIS